MRVTLTVDGTTSLDLSPSQVEGVVDKYYHELESDMGPVWNLLSTYPSSRVRRNIASRGEMLSSAAIKRLIRDSSLIVRHTLLENEWACRRIPHDDLVACIDASADLAELVAKNLEHCRRGKKKKLVRQLVGHPDPIVRSTIAGSKYLSRELREILRNDDDLSVRAVAKHYYDR